MVMNSDFPPCEPQSKSHTQKSFPALNKIPPKRILNNKNKGFSLILANLPVTYTIADVRGLVEESNPLHIDDLEETRAFGLKFCCIVLPTADSLMYLMNKLNNFIICGTKLIAVDAERLLEWRRGT